MVQRLITVLRVEMSVWSSSAKKVLFLLFSIDPNERQRTTNDDTNDGARVIGDGGDDGHYLYRYLYLWREARCWGSFCTWVRWCFPFSLLFKT